MAETGVKRARQRGVETCREDRHRSRTEPKRRAEKKIKKNYSEAFRRQFSDPLSADLRFLSMLISLSLFSARSCCRPPHPPLRCPCPGIFVVVIAAEGRSHEPDEGEASGTRDLPLQLSIGTSGATIKQKRWNSDDGDGDPKPGTTSIKPTMYSMRRSCEPYPRRKTKCDGGQPCWSDYHLSVCWAHRRVGLV